MNRATLLVVAAALSLAACGGADSAESRGEALVQDLGCVTCHSDDANALGPSWVGVAGSFRSLEGGRVVVADETYLAVGGSVQTRLNEVVWFAPRFSLNTAVRL